MNAVWCCSISTICLRKSLWTCAKSHVSDWSAVRLVCSTLAAKMPSPRKKKCSYFRFVQLWTRRLEIATALCGWKWTLVVQLCTFHMRAGGETAYSPFAINTRWQGPSAWLRYLVVAAARRYIAWAFGTYIRRASIFLRAWDMRNLTCKTKCFLRPPLTGGRSLAVCLRLVLDVLTSDRAAEFSRKAYKKISEMWELDTY